MIPTDQPDRARLRELAHAIIEHNYGLPVTKSVSELAHGVLALTEPVAGLPGESLTLRDLDRKHPFERAKAYRVSGDTVCDTLQLLALLDAENRELKRRLAAPPKKGAHRNLKGE